MKTPARSAAIGKALQSEGHGLPADFAARVASLAQAGGTARVSRWQVAALGLAFAAMLGVCAAGWAQFGPREPTITEWLAPLVDSLAARPWLAMAIAGLAIVQGLTFRRRSLT